MTGPYFTVELRGERCGCATLLTHLYVLIPVLDDDKHYWVGEDEVEKLLRHGEGWLATHPEREVIASRYLKHQRRLVARRSRAAADEEPDPDEDADEPRPRRRRRSREPMQPERAAARRGRRGAQGSRRAARARPRLRRGQAAAATARATGSSTEIVGVDVSHRGARDAPRERLQLDRLPERQRERVKLFQGSLIYRDGGWRVRRGGASSRSSSI